MNSKGNDTTKATDAYIPATIAPTYIAPIVGPRSGAAERRRIIAGILVPQERSDKVQVKSREYRCSVSG